MRARNAHIIQLPFPSLATPAEAIVSYYRHYSRVFSRFVEGYFIPEGSLWELPLWVAHLAGMLGSLGLVPDLIDLSKTAANADVCASELLARTRPGEVLLLSPLAQNFDLAIEVSRALMREQRITVLGGNMVTLATQDDATVIHHGQATPKSLEAALTDNSRTVTNFFARGEEATWLPDYRLFEKHRGKVPLLRLNASHGCLYACDFCGDAWSRRLVLVPPAVLEHEVRQFERLFPDVRLIYIGDKTFGQSPEAVKNLLELFSSRRQYRFIIQTHILAIDDELLDAMERLGVIVVELGFESASTELLRTSHKSNRTPEFYKDRIARITRRGMRVILNVLAGLPTETVEHHKETLAFIESADSGGWLYNLYNFVPYPLTQQFAMLRDRIIDWDFSHWREDGPPVFQPYHVTPEENYGLFLEKVRCAEDAILRTYPGWCPPAPAVKGLVLSAVDS